MLGYFSHSHNNYGRDPHSDLNSLPPERQRLANQKLGIFTILWFWRCQCHYLISCSLPNTAKTICCPLCKDEHFWSTCAFITFYQTSGVFFFVLSSSCFPFTRSSNTFLWRCSSFPPFVLPQQDVAIGTVVLRHVESG